MIDGQTPRGWYDVGGGYAGMWDGEQWTGERISHQQLRALTGPPPPPGATPMMQSYPPPAGRPQGMLRLWGTPWFVWVILAVIALIFGLPMLAAFMEGFSNGLNGR